MAPTTTPGISDRRKTGTHGYPFAYRFNDVLDFDNLRPCLRASVFVTENTALLIVIVLYNRQSPANNI